MNKIEEALLKIFTKYRIVFWYDENEELREQFDKMELTGIEKIIVVNNPFYIKHLTSREKPKSKFLLYFPYKKPSNTDNWLLDIELANYVFQTKQEALYAQEMELDFEYTNLISEHLLFFKNIERRAKLKEILGKDDDHHAIRYKMLSVLFDTDNVNLSSFIQIHATAFNDDNLRYDRELERYGLKLFYWNEINRKYGYKSEKPSIYDFLIEVFNSNFCIGTQKSITRESKLLLSMWKDSISYQQSYRKLSERIATDLKVESKLNEVSLDEIIQDDMFELIDRRIISELASLICNDAISTERLNQLVKQRENKYWYGDFESFYDCLQTAMQMLGQIKKTDKSKISSFSDGVNIYVQQLFKIDYNYRKYIFHYRKTKQNKVLQPLTEKVEKIYCNDWLLNYGNSWQQVINSTDKWLNQHKVSQQRFFNDHVKPIVSKQQRLFVIVSDALRYECGWEYLRKIQTEKRFEGELEYMVSTLPSYTQLGMAALLPNSSISIQNQSDSVLIDGNQTMGVQGRAKILEQLSGVRATAINAEDFMKLNTASDGREFVKKYDLIYIYHNRIDKIGDDKTSEDKVFDAVEHELDFLMDMIKKIANMNGNNMFITADHGFLYQNNAL
ncbi:MAG TPA: BREX-1 system phosphatase PglZ type A, partial [Tenuifilaceae bacterium]|nr:BREX-1 system phosphatase PglZ type A [Tenuifilaceae bacterium]